ncbi:hypothetical protein GCM10010911_07250 [Paenibacillus nasutitermitis]|uniref:Uncharacterized protein n=1 Tax=Paenibacillus nasutitermitis TaxID=1652958 RepID=A0A916YLW6_9BACL|nr:hypothetical protein GCM10010911_07250 [Paenibacillus nasutitermitis]
MVNRIKYLGDSIYIKNIDSYLNIYFELTKKMETIRNLTIKYKLNTFQKSNPI